ncbi:MAG: choloylglycine hydrolase family protein [Ruminococcaceae bacterium]|nr:choloylglycine hydrolase family protein [Oscillospiraceae bacterium]
MCTALTYKTENHYFGRNLDLERGYGEEVVITSRNYPLMFRHTKVIKNHYALIGTAAVVDGYPLYFEATNEAGVSMAGLNFPQNAVYYDLMEKKTNIASFELIPYLLGTADSIDKVRQMLSKINVVNTSFAENLPASPLHWIIADKQESVVLECTKNGITLYDNPFGVLTNNPTFDYHLTNINNYMGLFEGAAENKLCPEHQLNNYSLGLGALGLPGDFSSGSRFVKTVFLKQKSVLCSSNKDSVNQFFHILDAVAMPKGCVMTRNGEYEYTRYSCCINTDTKVFYYKTYDNSTIRNVGMYSVDLDGDKLYNYKME